MSTENWKRIENLVMIAVTAATTAIMGWLVAHGYIRDDIESAKIEAMAQTDAQTQVLAAETKAEAVKTRKKVVEETNEVPALVAKDNREVAAELVQAAPVMRSAGDPAIADLLLDLQAQIDQLKAEQAENP